MRFTLSRMGQLYPVYPCLLGLFATGVSGILPPTASLAHFQLRFSSGRYTETVDACKPGTRQGKLRGYSLRIPDYDIRPIDLAPACAPPGTRRPLTVGADCRLRHRVYRRDPRPRRQPDGARPVGGAHLGLPGGRHRAEALRRQGAQGAIDAEKRPTDLPGENPAGQWPCPKRRSRRPERPSAPLLIATRREFCYAHSGGGR